MPPQDPPTFGWPAEVLRGVTDAVGPVLGSEGLAGMSGRHVRRVDGERGPVVVKGPVATREHAFYTDVAPLLDGVPVPHLLCGWHQAGEAWLVLEHLPGLLPKAEWTGRAVHQVLARLHTTGSGAFDRLSDPFLPRWTDEMTRDVGAVLGVELGPWQDEAQGWLEGDSPISGDANPGNWAARADGTLVLLDWERAGRGAAVIDIATTIPGLPEVGTVETVVAHYREARDELGAPLETGDLVRGVLLAKLWTAVELLHEDRDDRRLRTTQDWLRHALPAWLEQWN